MKEKLSARMISGLKAPEDVLYEVWDTVVRGFGVRVNPSGKKVYISRYRANGKQRRAELGEFEDIEFSEARGKAIELQRAAKKGVDTVAELNADRDATSFALLLDSYLENHAKVKKRTWKDDEIRINRYLRPRWGERKPWQVRRDDVQDLTDELTSAGKKTQANRVRALVSRIFRYALSRRSFNRNLDFNPCSGLDAKNPEKRRDRVLSDDEVKTLWSTSTRADLKTRAFIQLRLLTLQRGEEIVRMRDDQIDGDWWTIPAESMKRGRPQRVWLSPQAKGIIDDLAKQKRDGWLFPARTHAAKKGHWSFNIAVGALMRSVVPGAHSKDLRRTAGTMMVRNGVCSHEELSRILSHAQGGVTSIYNLYSYDPEKQRIFGDWAKRLATLVKKPDHLAIALGELGRKRKSKAKSKKAA